MSMKFDIQPASNPTSEKDRVAKLDGLEWSSQSGCTPAVHTRIWLWESLG